MGDQSTGNNPPDTDMQVVIPNPIHLIPSPHNPSVSHSTTNPAHPVLGYSAHTPTLPPPSQAVTTPPNQAIVPSNARPNTRTASELGSFITTALCACEQDSSFDLPELQDALVRFFEEGEVSDEVDNYFTKVSTCRVFYP
ncbi:unnamed protein product [Echinostoma caproni]|uniref:DUF1421 domain-containing protein n=1 Tax=Echinostoma caproni TaxID=27848 RepID=A0A183AAU9_9TREM|nr:unnamed protein product [Echinostoma caproni]